MISEYQVDVVKGTGSIDINLAGVPQATGIPTSAGATVVAVSDVPESTGEATVNLGSIL